MGEYLPHLMFSAGIMILIWILMKQRWRVGRRNRSRDSNQPLVRNPRPNSSEWTMSDGSHELTKWQVEMLERTRDFQATVDTKLLLLQRMLAAIEQQGGKADKELLKECHDLATQGSPQLLPVSEILCDDAMRGEIYARAESGQSAEEICTQLKIDCEVVQSILDLRSETN